MYLDFFDRKILDVLNRRSGPMTLAELVKDSGFAGQQSSSTWRGLDLRGSF